jgi:hypothetical protein
LSVAWRDFELLLKTELPEFADTVRRHREEWPDLPMEYMLIGQLYNFAVNALKCEPNDVGREVARRVYAVVERALADGDESVQNCFSIEMIEPFTITHDPTIESMMGPTTLQDLGVKREWSRRHKAMSSAILSANTKLGCDVFMSVGIGTDTARVIAHSSLWTSLPQAKREEAFRSLRKYWMDLRGIRESTPESGLEFTGTREEMFVKLAADDGPDEVGRP